MKTLKLNQMENIEGGTFTWGWECAVGMLGVGFGLASIVMSAGTSIAVFGGAMVSVVGMAQSCDQ